MKNKIIKYFFILLTFSIALQACEDMLEPDKDNNYTIDRAYKDPAYAEGLLDRAYLLLGNNYLLEDVATDDAVSNDRNNGFLRMATGEWSSLYNPISKWNVSYDAIVNMNYFLSVIDDIEWSYESPERNANFKKRYRGEALGLRAYYYIQLLRYHGGEAENGEMLGVPLITDVLSTKDNWALPRASYQECVGQIIKNLDEAYSLLPFNWGEGGTSDPEYVKVYGIDYKNRINGEAVKALKSRIQLHAASPAFNGGNYNTAIVEDAAKTAGELLKQNGGISGFDNGGHLFYDADNDVDRAEILWRNNYGNSNNRERESFPPSLFGNGDVNPTQNLVDAFPMLNGYPITSALSGYDPTSPYSGRDPRLKAYIVYHGNKIGNNVINTDNDSPQNGLNKLTTSTRTGYYMLKLLRTNVNLDPKVNSSARHFYTHIRYTEIYLNYAEAANQAWGPDGDPNGYGFTARSVISAIRKRGGIPAADPYLTSITTKSAMAELIKNERRLELCFEGFRFWDLRRWDQPINETAKGVSINGTTHSIIDVENRNYQPFMIYGPIANNEIIKYGGLIQNKGW